MNSKSSLKASKTSKAVKPKSSQPQADATVPSTPAQDSRPTRFDAWILHNFRPHLVRGIPVDRAGLVLVFPIGLTSVTITDSTPLWATEVDALSFVVEAARRHLEESEKALLEAKQKGAMLSMPAAPPSMEVVEDEGTKTSSTAPN